MVRPPSSGQVGTHSGKIKQDELPRVSLLLPKDEVLGPYCWVARSVKVVKPDSVWGQNLRIQAPRPRAVSLQFGYEREWHRFIFWI